MTEEFKKSDLEILVSTMNRNNLDFLIPIFSFSHFSDFNILVVNQTTENNLLVSDFPNVRVINSFEKGLSKSRNLALENAIGKIILIADDDIRCLKDFDQNIIDAYNQNSDASIICFQTKTTENTSFRNYKKNKFWMKPRDFVWVLSIEITFKNSDLKSKKIKYNEHFGLSAKFQDSESLYFLRRADHNKLKVMFMPKDIVVHDKISSSDELTSDRWLYAKTASYYKRYTWLSYLLLFKLLFFLLRKKFISFQDIRNKTNIGLKGILDYKLLLKSNSEHYYD